MTKYQNDYTLLNHPSLFCHDREPATVGLTSIQAKSEVMMTNLRRMLPFGISVCVIAGVG
ncbi:MAG: hypothetical protein R3C02_05435 [Planctomycetaceae bacterium]